MTADPYGRGAAQDVEPRCWRCHRMLARLLTRPWKIDCPRCKAANSGGDVPNPGEGNR